MEHQALLQSSPEKPHQETTEAPPEDLNNLRHEAFDYLPSMVSINRGAAARTGQVPDLSGLPIIKRDTIEDILTDAKDPATPQRWVKFADMVTSTPIVLGRPVEHLVEWTTQIGASREPSIFKAQQYI